MGETIKKYYSPVVYCDGKVCYDKKGAVTAKNKRWKDDRVKLRIYPCPLCHNWHLTKKLKYGN